MDMYDILYMSIDTFHFFLYRIYAKNPTGYDNKMDGIDSIDIAKVGPPVELLLPSEASLLPGTKHVY